MSDCPTAITELTVQAWVESEDARGEALQALVSKWSPPAAFVGFSAFDATATDGLASRGYFGAVFDGRYVYFVPEKHGEPGHPTHGIVLRYDTHADFKSASSYAAYDAGHTDGLETRGYYGAAFDGRYIFFVPRMLDRDYHSCLLRFDTHGEFKSADSWAAYDIGVPQSQQSAAFDGRYLYLCPGYNASAGPASHSGCVIRCDTGADFRDPASYQTIDLTTFFGAACACFDGAAYDGRYVYLVPLHNGIVARFDTAGEFADPGSWAAFDARNNGIGECVGAVYDGRFLYFCAYAHGRIVRYDTTAPFTAASSWTGYDADPTDGIRTTGFDGGFFDGRYVWFQPFFLRAQPTDDELTFHSHYLRYDVNGAFDDPHSWQACDASATDGLRSIGYNGGAFDGRYFYAAPWQQGPKPGQPEEWITHGIILRTDTIGDHGSFSLRYCDYGHNGGLNAALPGPSFLINTERGARSVSAQRLLPAGRHHLAGVYDGRRLRLYIDGELAAEQSGGGPLINSDAPLTIGCIAGGGAAFRGSIRGTRVEAVARTAAEIREAPWPT